MFNNRFNSTHKDPLVEAVRQAQQDGDLRRQAEAFVNEEFGVYSRQAVVRENLAAYDARLEEAYKCMKEGKPLDPVGKEDGDVDNDGDSDKSDKYLLNRRKAIGKSMGKRMEEESDGLPPSAAAKQAAKQTSTPASTPAPTKTKDLSSTFSSARGATGMNEEQIDEISKELAGRYIKKADYKRSDSSFQSGKVYGKELATKKRTKQDVEDARKHNRDSFKREKGINTAVNKLTGRAKVQANEEVMKESIKAKLFAKHMKEDSSFKSAQVTGKSVIKEFSQQQADNWFKSNVTGPVKAYMGRKLTYNPDKPTIGSQLGKTATGNEPTSSVFARMSGRPAPAAVTSTPAATTTPSSSGAGTGSVSADTTPGSTTAAPQTAPTSTKPATAPTSTASKASVSSKPAVSKGGYFKSAPNVSKGDYTIRRGDTLSAIAKAKGTSVGAIQSMNKGLTNVNKIAAGGQLNLPTAMKSPSAGSSTATATASDVKPTGSEFPKAKASPSTAMPPRRPSMGPEAPAPKADPVTPSTPATPTGGSPSMKPDYHRTTLPGNRTGDVTPTAKPTAMAPDVGRSSPSTGSGSNISVAPEKSSTASPPPEEKKKAPAPAPATTAVEHRLSESVVSVGANRYRIV